MSSPSPPSPAAARRCLLSLAAALLVAGTSVLSSCRSAGEYRREADETAYSIIDRQREQSLGETEPFTIERPADALRRRLLLGQKLPRGSAASLGADALEPTEHWPEDDYLQRSDEQRRIVTPPVVTDAADHGPVEMTLNEALQVAARNSRDYQNQKEQVFLAALDLDLERDFFRNTFFALIEGLWSTDRSSGESVTGVEGSLLAGFTRRLMTGGQIAGEIGLDVVQLLTQGEAFSRGLLVDASIELPLLRGAGRWVVTEPLTQAERDTVYAIYEFERFKRTFAVQVASQYLGVLRQLDEVRNAEENYRRVAISARRARALANEGRLPELQVDQAVQDELRARNRWISAREAYEAQLDQFKVLLGLPTDAHIELSRGTLEQLARSVEAALPGLTETELGEEEGEVPPADAAVELTPPRDEEGGPLEMDPRRAVELALAHRLDLRVAEGEVYDALRQVAVAANAFLPELTLLAAGSSGSRRTIGSATSDDAQVRFDRGRYDALLSLDLPLERTAERNAYRAQLIGLERAVRDVQGLEDRIKLDVRGQLRDLLESRESLRIQAQSVALAERRVDSTSLLLELGRAEIRDVLEAQEALVSAQNALTSALVNYRVSELELQRDLGLLEVNERGLWEEYRPNERNEDASDEPQ
ncbi:MAG: TolC family protein [Phycisphaeraceae bacterium]